MEEINNIHWHDCELVSIVELPDKDMLVFNVLYPENWEQNIFLPKGIIFKGYYYQEVNEIPFEGNPTILAASVAAEKNEFTTIRLETNIGYRLITAKNISIGNQVVSI